MADKISIRGGTPVVDLGVRSWTGDLARPELLNWATVDDPALTVHGGRIVAVAGRVGPGLRKSADSTGPVRQVRNGYAAAKFTRGQLNYLHAPVIVDSASFTMAAVIYIDVYTTSARDLMGVFESGNSLRFWQAAGRYDVRNGAATVLAGSRVFNQGGNHLVIWSQHDGEAAVRIHHIGGAVESLRGESGVTVGQQCTPVFGADEIANGQAGATPTVSRTWDDCILETWTYAGIDLLAESHEADLARLVAYFTTVYGAAS